MSQRNRLMLLFLAICLAGCGYSTHPLSDEKTNAVDRELLGTWEFVKEPERKDRLHVGLRKGSNAELEVAVVTVKDGRVLVAREPLRTTKIGGEKYLSVPLALDGKENSRLKQVAWLPGRYRVKGDRLVLEFLDLDRTSAAIDAGEIEGQVEEIDISAIVSQAADTLHRWDRPEAEGAARSRRQAQEADSYARPHGEHRAAPQVDLDSRCPLLCTAGGRQRDNAARRKPHGPIAPEASECLQG